MFDLFEVRRVWRITVYEAAVAQLGKQEVRVPYSSQNSRCTTGQALVSASYNDGRHGQLLFLRRDRMNMQKSGVEKDSVTWERSQQTNVK
jgi:hypothetical protein